MAATKKHKLTDAQRAWVVQQLACYDAPKEVAAALKEQFGVEITPQAVEAYDPTKRAGANLAQKWKALFETARKAFLADIEAHVPLANKAVRVRMLERAARAMQHRGNWVGMADMIERIAKEVGNVHTNRRELTGKDGKPLEVNYSDMTEEQLNARLMQVLGTVATDEEGAGDDRDRSSAATTH